MKYSQLKYVVLCLSVFTLAGCDFMDCDESSDYNKSDIFESYNRTSQMVTNIYSYLPHDFCNTEGAMLDAATDDAIHVYESSNIQRFINGTWSANYTANDVWSMYYNGIRAANLYLKEAAGLTFDEWQYADDYQSIMKDFNNYQYEVRFLRAFFYFELVKRYNNVPLVTEILTPVQANEVKPATFAQVTDFILSECTQIALPLPVDYDGFTNKETGRITKGAALALKARVALYAASPLFTANSQEKWEAAAKAAYEIIDPKAKLGYKLDTYPNLFNATNNTSAEVILSRPTGESGSFESANFPMGVERGGTSTCPTQNLMEAYEMKNGEPFNWENPEMQKEAYNAALRDPRMAMTIVYNGMKWPKNTIEIWEGGANGLPLNNATKTGYYLKKYVNNEISFASGSKVTKKHHSWVLFRYAEVLLNYAEAMVNAFNDPSFKNETYPMSALEAVNIVRDREGVKMPTLPTSLSPAEFMVRLKNERRVELAFEGHRFWDMRRWKELKDMSKVYSVKVEKTEGVMKYTKFLYATREMNDRMYFYPISNIEKNKNQNLKQNEGW